MKILAQYITRKRRGGILVRDRRFESDIIRIGRGTVCELQLSDPRVMLEQAQLTLRSGGLYIESNAGSSISVNGTYAQAAKLKESDVIEIGPFQIIIESAEHDTDVTLSIELLEPLSNEFDNIKQHTIMGVGKIGLSKRAWSWALFSACITGMLIWPMITSWLTTEPTVNLQSGMPFKFEAAPTSIWTTGTISSDHKFFGESCEVCHERPFIQVQDSACLQCHQTIGQHTDPMLFSTAAFEGESCQDCHKEHQGNQSVIRNDQEFCVSCHGDLKEKEPGATLYNASDFGTAHPQLYPSVVTNSSPHIISRSIPMNSEPGPREASGLSFPHADHLREAGVHHPREGVIHLECQSCHVPEKGGTALLPISFEQHCHECHELTFDTQLPGREMIHATPDKLFQQIADIYDATAMRGGYREPQITEIIRRRPGVQLTESERREVRSWAKTKTESILNGRFGRGRCAECHTVTYNGPGSAWTVKPIHITKDWFPKSFFDHGSHDDVACVTCHDVINSIESADVLMPSIETCQNCHGGETATNRVPSTCITCHQFHNDGIGPMQAGKEASSVSTHNFAAIQASSRVQIIGTQE
ncbi:MAG: cytochrome c3 family protein [Rhodospirillaceae bacterium]